MSLTTEQEEINLTTQQRKYIKIIRKRINYINRLDYDKQEYLIERISSSLSRQFKDPVNSSKDYFSIEVKNLISKLNEIRIDRVFYELGNMKDELTSLVGEKD